MRQRTIFLGFAVAALATVALIARGGDASAGAPTARTPAGGTSTPAPLTAADVKAGMSKIVGKVMACHTQHRVPGLLKIKLVIAADGKVTSASALGTYAGTPMGTCAENAVLTAKFKPNAGGITVTYPFSLR
jgi:hypothetical protein